MLQLDLFPFIITVARFTGFNPYTTDPILQPTTQLERGHLLSTAARHHHFHSLALSLISHNVHFSSRPFDTTLVRIYINSIGIRYDLHSSLVIIRLIPPLPPMTS